MYHITLLNKNKKVNIFDIYDKEEIVKYFAAQYLMNVNFQFDGNKLHKKNITDLRIIETDRTIGEIVKKRNNEFLKEKKVPLMRTRELLIYNDNIGNNITELILKEAEEFRKEIGL